MVSCMTGVANTSSIRGLSSSKYAMRHCPWWYSRKIRCSSGSSLYSSRRRCLSVLEKHVLIREIFFSGNFSWRNVVTGKPFRRSAADPSQLGALCPSPAAHPDDLGRRGSSRCGVHILRPSAALVAGLATALRRRPVWLSRPARCLSPRHRQSPS